MDMDKEKLEKMEAATVVAATILGAIQRSGNPDLFKDALAVMDYFDAQEDDDRDEVTMAAVDRLRGMFEYLDAVVDGLTQAAEKFTDIDGETRAEIERRAEEAS